MLEYVHGGASVLCDFARMSCRPVFPANHGLECLDYLGRNCIMDLSAGGMLSPSTGLLPGVAVPLPAVWDPLFALSPVEELTGTGAEVVGRSLAVRGGWSGPDVAGISAVVARVGMCAVLLNIGAPSDRAVGCPAWDGGCHREMVDD